MTIRVSRYNMDDLIALFPVLFGILIAMAILAWVAVYFVKRMDNNKPLITRRVKILEKILERLNGMLLNLKMENV